MLDALPWPAALGVSGGGWVLFGSTVWVFYRSLVRGDVRTGREFDGMKSRAEKAEGANEKLIDQNGQLMDMARLGTATYKALQKAASDE